LDSEERRRWDAVEACMECITHCSLDDGSCVTTCVRDHLGNDEELWASSLCL
jgi:hypothetical protein